MTDTLEIIRKRRSIRRYADAQVPRGALEKIIEAGLCAPTAGGRQGTMIAALCGKTLSDRVGRLNLARFDRSRLSGSFVSREQPSVIDDPTIQSGFYGAPCVCAVFAERDFLYSIPDAFCAAENMVIEATALGIASCIVARGGGDLRKRRGKTPACTMGNPRRDGLPLLRAAGLRGRRAAQSQSAQTRPQRDCGGVAGSSGRNARVAIAGRLQRNRWAISFRGARKCAIIMLARRKDDC